MTTAFDDTRPGDNVLVIFPDCTELATVERVTKTLLVVRHTKFRKSDGIQVAARRYNRAHIEPATPEHIARFRQLQETRQILRDIRKTTWETVPPQKLKDIHRILFPETKE